MIYLQLLHIFTDVYSSIKVGEDVCSENALERYVLMSSCRYGNDYLCRGVGEEESMYVVCGGEREYKGGMSSVYMYYKYGVCRSMRFMCSSVVLLKDVESWSWGGLLSGELCGVELCGGESSKINEEMLLDYVMPPSDVSKIEIDSKLKSELWQCSPILPEISYEELCLKHGV